MADTHFYVNINTMDNDFYKFAYWLNFQKQNSKSIYASGLYGIYRIEKKSKKVFHDGKLIANTCTYELI